MALMLDGIELELMWSHLRSVVTEQAKAMQRTAFSPVVREAGDLAYALFDARGRIVAQADTGTPGHINCLAFTGKYLAAKFKGRLRPGDVLITNDPWEGAGHFFDITVLAPIFWEGRLIGYVGSTNHHTDIGGLGVGVGANDVHEEGLWIPPAKLYEDGRPNELLHEIILRNVRTPDYLAGDLAAQVASAKGGGEALIELCRHYDLTDIEALSDAIVDLSETAMRNAIRACPAGSWTGETRFDIAGAGVVTLCATLTIDHDRAEVLIDFAGSSPQMSKGINVVLNYTHAYSTFTVRSCLTPTLPNNAGSLAPIKVSAPLGSIVNCKYPAPVAARHVVGMYVPMPLLKALYHIVPERVLAEGPGAVWSAQVIGTHDDGAPFVSSQFSFAGGMGARATRPGPSATCYPTGIGATPIEVLESETPIVFRRRELRPGSGGRGRSPGGDGQIVEFQVRTNRPWTLNAAPTGRQFGAEGLAGGGSGARGRFLVNGVDWEGQGKVLMRPGDLVHMETPGGGGFGPPRHAPHEASDEVTVMGRVSAMKETSAKRVFRWADLPTTELLDGTMRRSGFRGDACLLTFNRIAPTMPRWEPHSHPFDQIVLTVEGRQMLEIEGEAMECGPGTIVRVPANAKHTGWPVGDQPVLNIDVFPPREDYLFLVEYQKEYAARDASRAAEAIKTYHQVPSDNAFSGRLMADTRDVLYRWADLPGVELMDGKMKRAGFRGDDALLTFNWIAPGMERLESHAHPFDQIVLTMQGRMVLEIDGETMECGPGTVVRVPAEAVHTGWPIGEETVLNIDVFAPIRQDYLFLVDYQKEFGSNARK
jgi:N-methylhydantoinase B